jgi:hypothetical protein
MTQNTNPNIKNAETIPQEAYIIWGAEAASQEQATKASAGALEEYTLINKASASRRFYNDFSNLDTNTSSRPGLTRSDYDFFRPDEAIPIHVKAIIKKAEDIYQKVGLVKNVIDLMGDFAVQGIKIVHKNKRIERFYRQWFKKIGGKDRSERFLNNLYKTGNIVINRQTGKISTKIADQLYKAIGSPDLKIDYLPEMQLEKKEIPWRYTFIDPVCVEVAAGALSSFVTDKKYEIVLPAHLRRLINAPKTENERKVVENLPLAIVEAAKSKKAYPLEPAKTIVYHYKKDDWQTWAYPMIYAIMDDITIIEKLKLADMSALDGAISNIRIFKLGSLEHKIAPTKAATAKLAQILGNNVGGGTMDLVWGPDIELIESKTSVHQFLGEGKYVPHLNAVYAGLGIPPTLTGTFGAAGTTNNFISLKTLTQRLQYGRDILVDFWEKEIAAVQKAMGFRYPASIEFDRMDLSNEDTEKALLIQLADRNLISDELLQTKFGFDPDMEKSRLNRENRDRTSERMIKKAGPWHDPQFDNALKKLSLQLGIVTPSQVGLDLPNKKSSEQTALELKQKMSSTKLANDSSESLPGYPGEGRPKLSKDKQKRKTKTFSPQTGARVAIWANQTQDKIAEIMNPIMLSFYNKKNIRSLSKTQAQELDKIKTQILFNLSPETTVSQDSIKTAFAKIDQDRSLDIFNKFNNWSQELKLHAKNELTMEDMKYIKSSFYSLVYEYLL